MNLKTNPFQKLMRMTIILVISFFAINTFGQSSAKKKPQDRTQKIASKMMKRDMYYRVITPVGYAENKDAHYPVVYMLHGMGGSFKDFNDITNEYFGRHNYIIVIPDGARGFWVDSATVPNDKYESHLMQEIIPEVEKNFRVIANRQNRVIFGTSMGGYGSVILGLKHPDKFSLIGSIAGAIGVSEVTEKIFGQAGKKIFDSIFGPVAGEHRKANSVRDILNKMTPEQLKALPMIYQSHGTEDKLVELGNVVFLSILKDKKIRHEYRELPGAHDPRYFVDQIKEFLNYSDKHFVVSIAEIVSKTAKEKGGAAAIVEYKQLRSKYADRYYFSENELNQIGYELLGMDKTKDAIEIFKLNVEMFPKAANPYDSLGEAYLKNGQKDLALTNYKKSLELNPNNAGAVKVINDIKGKSVKLDSAILDTYVGEYEVQPGFILTVSKEGDKLMGQAPGQPKVELEQVSETKFFISVVNAGVTFEKDSSGKITGLTLVQGGQTTKAKKIK